MVSPAAATGSFGAAIFPARSPRMRRPSRRAFARHASRGSHPPLGEPLARERSLHESYVHRPTEGEDGFFLQDALGPHASFSSTWHSSTQYFLPVGSESPQYGSADTPG